MIKDKTKRRVVNNQPLFYVCDASNRRYHLIFILFLLLKIFISGWRNKLWQVHNKSKIEDTSLSKSHLENDRLQDNKTNGVRTGRNPNTNTTPRGRELTLKINKVLAQNAPVAAILVHIRLWNIILGMVITMIAAINYQTPCERLQHVNDSRKYKPKYKRWHKINWMKNIVIQSLQKAGSKLENWIDRNTV